MRLINVASMKLVQFFNDSQLPRYGILSHRWGSEEVTFQDYQKLLVKLHPGYEKIKKFCQKVAGEGLQYAWIDTCCIDKTSSAELSESINSMFAWYQKATVCFVYLSDVTVNRSKLISTEELALDPRLEREYLANRTALGELMSKSAWFLRGWTLQELLAPSYTRFYDAEWHYFGTKSDLEDVLADRTGIEKQYLSGSNIELASVAKRMSWASQRETTRIEDIAYCLLGIFGVNMPLLYGEGSRAFTRLQEEIMKDSADHSLFAWTASYRSPILSGPLATSPTAFADAGGVVPYPDLVGDSPYAMTNKGLRIDIPLYPYPDQDGLWLAILGCYNGQVERPLAILIQRVNSRVAESTQANQYGRFTMPGAPIPVTPEILSKAEISTIYLKRISVARSHDKEYSFSLRFAKSASLTVQRPTPNFKLLASDLACEVLAEKDKESEWLVSLASNSPNAGVLFKTDDLSSSKFLICVAISRPDTYLHELDRWLRSRCTCTLVAGRWGFLDKVSPSRMDHHIGKAYEGTEQKVAPTSDPRLCITAVVRKGFENGGKVIGVDLQFVECYEVETIEMPVELHAEEKRQLEPDADETEERPEPLEATIQSRIDAYGVLRELRSHVDLPDVWTTETVINGITRISDGQMQQTLGV